MERNLNIIRYSVGKIEVKKGDEVNYILELTSPVKK